MSKAINVIRLNSLLLVYLSQLLLKIQLRTRVGAEFLARENGLFPGIREVIPRFLPVECGGNHSEHPSGSHTALTHLSIST